MAYNDDCFFCRAEKKRKQEAEQVEIKFVHDGNTMTAKAKRYNDAFYEIKVGKYAGNLVHIFDLVN